MSTPQNLAIWRNRKGVVVWEFFRNLMRHEVKAAACVTKDFPGEPQSPEWLAHAQQWAQTAAENICARLDVEEWLQGRFDVAAEELEARVAEELSERVQMIRDYLESHPGVAPEQVRDILRPRVVTVIQAIRALTDGI